LNANCGTATDSAVGPREVAAGSSEREERLLFRRAARGFRRSLEP